jgi:hypothetical protein
MKRANFVLATMAGAAAITATGLAETNRKVYETEWKQDPYSMVFVKRYCVAQPRMIDGRRLTTQHREGRGSD